MKINKFNLYFSFTPHDVYKAKDLKPIGNAVLVNDPAERAIRKYAKASTISKNEDDIQRIVRTMAADIFQ